MPVVNMVGAFVRNAPFGTEIAFAKGMRAIGWDVHAVDPSVDDQPALRHDAAFTLVFKDGGRYNDALRTLDGPAIVYQPDDIRFPHIAQMMRDMRKFCDFALMFDTTGAKLAEQEGYVAADYLLLTADPDLYRGIDHRVHQKHYDFCFVGSMGGPESHRSRRRMCNLLSTAGYNVLVLTDCYDMTTIMSAFAVSRVVLNHATDVGQGFGAGYGYQCRHFEAGFTASCVLSNAILDEQSFRRRVVNVSTFDSEMELLSRARSVRYDMEGVIAAGMVLYDELNASHRPEHRAHDLVKFFEERCLRA